MLEAARNKLIALGFNAWTDWLRFKRVVRSAWKPRLQTLDHITIPVHDMAVARRFYCDVLGAEYMMTVDEALTLAWRYQHEPAPVVALLHEIRAQLPAASKLFDSAKKLGEVSIKSALARRLAALSRFLIASFRHISMAEVTLAGSAVWASCRYMSRRDCSWPSS